MGTLNRSHCWYHESVADEATAWIAGGARKGRRGTTTMIGLVRFNIGQMRNLLDGTVPPRAVLTVHRDLAYGTAEMDLSIAPCYLQATALEDMAYSDCLALAMRDLHRTVAIEGEATNIRIPGAWLRLMAMSHLNAFLIYREDDEGTTGELRLTDEVTLTFDEAGTYKAPVWLRPIGKGDIISDYKRSHIADLFELEYYINIRRDIQQLTPIDITAGNDVGLYADWHEVIEDLQDGMEEVITAEGGDPVEWCAIDPDELPKAEAINQLRQTLASYGEYEEIAVSDQALAYFEHLNTDFKVDRGKPVPWAAKAPNGGMCWQYEMRLLKPDDKEKTKVKVYMRRFGFWLLAPLLEDKIVSRLQLVVKRERGEQTTRAISLYGVRVSQLPAANASVNDVIDQSVIIATGGAAVGGDVSFEFTPEGIEALQDGTYYGAAVDDKDAWTNYGASATLIFNREDDEN